MRATFFRSFKNLGYPHAVCLLLGARTSYFLCDRLALSMTITKRQAEGACAHRVWIPADETLGRPPTNYPPRRADPILSWFSFQSSES